MYLLKCKSVGSYLGQAFRYHKVEALETVWYPGSYQFVIYEARFYTSEDQAGTEFAVSGTPFASSILGAGYEANKATDSNTGTFWSSDTSGLGSWGVDSGAGNSNIIRSLSIQVYTQGGYSFIPKSFVVKGSNDGTTYYTIATLITNNIASGSPIYYFNFNKSRLLATSGTVSTPRYLNISGNQTNDATISALPASAAYQKIYFEITAIEAVDNSIWVSLMGTAAQLVSLETAIYSCAIDFDAGKLWIAKNSTVSVAGTPTGTFTANTAWTSRILPNGTCTFSVTYNFGHYDDTPFSYTMPAGYARWSI